MDNKRISAALIGVVVLVAWMSQGVAVSEEAQQRGVPSLAPMLETVTPAVVNIQVSKAMPTSTRFYFNGEELPDTVRRYFEQNPEWGQEQRQRPYATGAGSGVIIDSELGYIVTNHHVIDDAAAINVQLNDGRTAEAILIGSDSETDIALLQIDAEDLMEIEFAEISSVRVGDYVVAIGNPFGIGQTVTSGIVSALGRNGLNNNNYEDYIQTDAAINLGNSGGALVDMEGRLIGINTVILSGNGGSNGVGFAVPADMVEAVFAHLERDGEVRRGLLGVAIVNATPEIVAALDIDIDSGAVVTSVMPDSAAERAGIQISDVIVEIDGREVNSSRELRNIVGLMRRDQAVELALYRGDQRMSIDAVIGGAEGRASIADSRPASSGDFRGAQLRNLEPGAVESVDAGVEIVSVAPQSRAFAAGVRPGDVITEVNRAAVDDLTEFNAAIEAGERYSALTVFRDGRRMLFFVP
ncbi:MAG: Do family serine endopeptidase [Pseudomonadales bacterium]|nr:Do family serine endopeptidase [Pseudomonadales bacterium]